MTEPTAQNLTVQADPLSIVVDIQATLAERGNNYGKFVDHARISQNLSQIVRNEPKWEKMDADMRESIEMLFHKIARIVNVDPLYKDSWVDLVGYSQLIVDRLNGKSQ